MPVTPADDWHTLYSWAGFGKALFRRGHPVTRKTNGALPLLCHIKAIGLWRTSHIPAASQSTALPATTFTAAQFAAARRSI